MYLYDETGKVNGVNQVLQRSCNSLLRSWAWESARCNNINNFQRTSHYFSAPMVANQIKTMHTVVEYLQVNKLIGKKISLLFCVERCKHSTSVCNDRHWRTVVIHLFQVEWNMHLAYSLAVLSEWEREREKETENTFATIQMCKCAICYACV